MAQIKTEQLRNDLFLSITTSLKIRLIVCIIASISIFGIGNMVQETLFIDTAPQSLPILNMVGQSIMVNENKDAVDPSFKTLIKFMSEDITEDKDYIYPVYTCGDFAARLHDEAEKNGIKCGVVGVKFNATSNENMSKASVSDLHSPPAYSSYDTCRGHAFNAFNTTDMGMVYVDSTGITTEEKRMANKPYDMIVYAQKGEDLGEIWINQAENLDYSYYKLKEEQYLKYRDNVNNYNQDVETFNKEIQTADLNSSAAINRKQELEAIRSKLEHCKEAELIIVGQMGIIDEIQVFW